MTIETRRSASLKEKGKKGDDATMTRETRFSTIEKEKGKKGDDATMTRETGFSTKEKEKGNDLCVTVMSDSSSQKENDAPSGTARRLIVLSDSLSLQKENDAPSRAGRRLILQSDSSSKEVKKPCETQNSRQAAVAHSKVPSSNAEASVQQKGKDSSSCEEVSSIPRLDAFRYPRSLAAVASGGCSPSANPSVEQEVISTPKPRALQYPRPSAAVASGSGVFSANTSVEQSKQVCKELVIAAHVGRKIPQKKRSYRETSKQVCKELVIAARVGLKIPQKKRSYRETVGWIYNPVEDFYNPVEDFPLAQIFGDISALSLPNEDVYRLLKFCRESIEDGRQCRFIFDRALFVMPPQVSSHSIPKAGSVFVINGMTIKDYLDEFDKNPGKGDWIEYYCCELFVNEGKDKMTLNFQYQNRSLLSRKAYSLVDYPWLICVQYFEGGHKKDGPILEDIKEAEEFVGLEGKLAEPDGDTALGHQQEEGGKAMETGLHGKGEGDAKVDEVGREPSGEESAEGKSSEAVDEKSSSGKGNGGLHGKERDNKSTKELLEAGEHENVNRDGINEEKSLHLLPQIVADFKQESEKVLTGLHQRTDDLVLKLNEKVEQILEAFIKKSTAILDKMEAMTKKLE